MDAATKSVVFFGVIGLLLAGSVVAVFQVRPGLVPIEYTARYLGESGCNLFRSHV